MPFNGHHLRPLVRLEPWPLKDLINLLDSHVRRLRDHDVHVSKRHSTPAGKEDKGTPVVRGLEQGGDAKLDGVDEQPVERLGDGGTERADTIRPEFAAKDV